MQRHVHVFLALSVFAGGVMSQSVIVPNANATVRGVSGLNTLTRNAANPRTYMLGMPAAELAGIPVGSYINGVSFRAFLDAVQVPLTWPPTDTSWTDYEVSVGNAIAPGTWTVTFATNFTGTPVMVRDGPMTIEANTFINTPTLPAPQPNPWGNFFWDFQKPFLYTGGDLGFLFTHTGSSQATSFLFIDVINNAPATGVGFSATGFQAPVGAVATYSIARVHYGYGTGCPGTGAQVPNLVLSNNVAGGGSTTVALGNAPAGTAAIHVIGTGVGNTPLPNGCFLRVQNPVIYLPVATSALGRSQFSVSFPAGLSLAATVQTFVIDAGAPSNYSATNGVALTVTP